MNVPALLTQRLSYSKILHSYLNSKMNSWVQVLVGLAMVSDVCHPVTLQLPSSEAEESLRGNHRAIKQ